ncbi:hypothetical protein L1887_62040 [Cichorium endivia]|nr:hypothetical protein L1887_62040 [Cichorium endivia]
MEAGGRGLRGNAGRAGGRVDTATGRIEARPRSAASKFAFRRPADVGRQAEVKPRSAGRTGQASQCGSGSGSGRDSGAAGPKSRRSKSGRGRRRGAKGGARLARSSVKSARMLGRAERGGGWAEAGLNSARRAAAKPLDARAAVGAPGIPSAGLQPPRHPKKKKKRPSHVVRQEQDIRKVGEPLARACSTKKETKPHTVTAVRHSRMKALLPHRCFRRAADRCLRHDRWLCKGGPSPHSLSTTVSHRKKE